MLPTIHRAALDLHAGRLSPVDLLEQCLARLDRYESQVRAWVLVDRAGARIEAERRAEEGRRGQWRGPLHGIPIAIKDIFDVFDWPTAAGSQCWAQAIARQDAVVVHRLRQGGAVFLGKTVTTAYASFDPPPTRNPWHLRHTPGGSSSGSAAALACGMCLGALGSQTGGSITRPASFCGVAGCKPTYGRLPLTGVVPLAPTLDHPGPMARRVRDLALLLQAMAGPDPGAPSPSPPSVPDWSAALDRPLPAPRLGLLKGLFHDRADPTMRSVMARVVEKLATAGAAIQERALPASFAEVLPRHRMVMAVEAARFHEPRLRAHPDDYPPCITALVREGLACPAPEYARCLEHRVELIRDMETTLIGLDALLMPAALGPAPEAGTTGDPAFNSPWSYTGLPTVTFPVAFSAEGLPVGVQLVGRAWDEGALFSAAAWSEDVLGFDPGEPEARD
jgi:Asp-tRNA(Asn)/Glu-tRNA(Gln) amidotransferase A subunit family amidase